MVGGNFAGNIIVNLASLPDFLRNPILKKRMVEFFSLGITEQEEVINNALEAGPTIPFPNFSKLFKTWLKILVILPDEQREGLFGAYINEIAQNPEKLIMFNLDGILEIFLSLEQDERDTLSKSVGKIIGKLDDQQKRKIMLVIPNNAKKHLNI